MKQKMILKKDWESIRVSCSEMQNCPVENTVNCPHARFTQTKPERTWTWVDMVGFYPAQQECLSAFLVASAAEVLAGVKPANLIRISNRRLPCGRDMFSLWQEYGEEVLSSSLLCALPLRMEEGAVLLLLYRSDLLKRRLRGRTMRVFLAKNGYPLPLTLENTLQHLHDAFQTAAMPDEVGMFLGYPAKDVNGFMERASEPWHGRCLWRIYGPPQRSLRLYHHYCKEGRFVTGQLLAGCSPQALLQAV